MAKKITLANGKQGTLFYRGENEDERIESAVLFGDLGKMGAHLQQAGFMTPQYEHVINTCMDYFIEIIPDDEPVVQTQAPPVSTDTPPEPDIPSRTARRRIT